MHVFKWCTVDRLYVRICITRRQRATLHHGGSPIGFFFFLLRRRFLRGWLAVPLGAIDGGPVRLRMDGEGIVAFPVDIAPAPVRDRWIGRLSRRDGDVGNVRELAATRCGSESVRNTEAPTTTYRCLTPQRHHPEILAEAASPPMSLVEIVSMHPRSAQRRRYA